MPGPAKKKLKRASPTRISKRVMAKPRTRVVTTLKHFAANLSESHETSKKQTEVVLGDLVVTKHLKKGDRIRLGFVREPAARIGHPVMRWPLDGKAGKKDVGPWGSVIKIKGSKKGAGRVATGSLMPAEALIADEPAQSAYEPSARALALLRGKEICESDLKASGGAFTLQNVQRLLGISRQAIEKKVREDALLAVPGPHGRRRYPVVQFTRDGMLPGIEDVLKSLPSANGWFRLNFLINPDARLGGRRPIDLLKERKVDPVVMAAKAVGVQGA